MKIGGKTPPGAGASSKDIDSLFSSAGMIGAKYREFPRPDAVKPFNEQECRPVKTAMLRTRVLVPCERAEAAAPAHEAQTASSLDRPQSAASHGSLWSRYSPTGPGAELPHPLHARVKMAILSLAGGVGKTTLAVSLARILSGMHRQVLLADCGLFPTIPHHLGARGQRLGALQFFYAPASAAALPVGMFRLPLAELHKRGFQELLEQVEASESLLLIDLPTLHGTPAAEVMAHVDHVLVPVTPDVHSIGGLSHLKQLLASSERHVQVHYLINRFDDSQVLHHEIRERLPNFFTAVFCRS